MSYRLVDANKLAIKYPEVNDMSCIYADLPNGLDDGHYVLEPRHKGHWIGVSKDELPSDDYSNLSCWCRCSECGEVQLVIIPRECKFCRNCGADMRGDTE